MACADSTSIEEYGYDFTCAICREEYTTPRYLPVCGHTFCEKCLSDLISNVKVKVDSESKFDCPVCRKTQCFQEKGQSDIVCGTSFPINTVVVKMMVSRPGSAERPTARESRWACDPCKKREETGDGVKYCFHCTQIYCETCIKYHQSFSTTEGHRCVDLDIFSPGSTQTDVLQDFMKCPVHPQQELQFYCENDDAVLCGLCAKAEEKSFADLDVLTDAEVREQSEEETLELKANLEAATRHLELLQKLQTDNIQELQAKMNEIKTRTEQIKEQVVQVMEKMVQHVSEITKQILVETENKVDDNIRRIKGIVKQPKQDVVLLTTVSQHGSERHKFVVSKQLKKRLEETEQQIALEDARLERYCAVVNFADYLNKLVETADIQTLVQINLEDKGSDHKHYENATNFMKDFKLVADATYKVRPLESGCSPTYTGIAVNRDGLIILCDNCGDSKCGFLCIYSSVFQQMLKLKMNKPFCAVPISKKQIAVTVSDDNAICIVRFDTNLKIEKTLRTRHKPKSLVALKGGRLAVSWGSPAAFGIVDVSGPELILQSYLTGDSNGRRFNSFDYFTIDEKRDHVIQTCSEDKAVYCFDLSGQPVFKYTDSGLRSPQGVALDRLGNIYVCDYGANSIHKLLPAGQKLNIFQGNIPARPLAICSDRSGINLFITGNAWRCSDEIHVYKLA